MSRLTDTFARTKREGRAALVIYFCAGDPDPETTVEVCVAAAEAGADVIELGMPFSDPTADGVAIQRASERALRGGMTLQRRSRSRAPFVRARACRSCCSATTTRSWRTAKRR